MLDGSTHPDTSDRIKRGIANVSRTIGLMINCLCSLNCLRICSLKGIFLCAVDRCRAVPKIINTAEQRFAINGIIRWTNKVKVL